MMSGKNERKKGHTGLKMAVGALAVVGAMGIVKKGKRWVEGKAERIAGSMRKDRDDIM